MFRKTVGAAAIIAVLAALLSGCGAANDDGGTAYERIQAKLISLESYEAGASVTYISNKTSHTYETKQQCRMTGEYRIEVTGPERVAGNVTVSDGKTVCQFNARVAGKLSIATTEAMERTELFLTSFVKNYVRSQEVTVSVASVGDASCTVLEAVIPGEHPYLRSERLWVDNQTLKPVKLVICDPSGAERVVVTYHTFEYNITLKDEIFTVD